MKTIPLAEYCDRRSQADAGRVLGWTQGAVWQALKAGRQIFIVESEDGSASAYEVRQISGAPVRVMPVTVAA